MPKAKTRMGWTLTLTGTSRLEHTVENAGRLIADLERVGGVVRAEFSGKVLGTRIGVTSKVVAARRNERWLSL